MKRYRKTGIKCNARRPRRKITASKFFIDSVNDELRRIAQETLETSELENIDRRTYIDEESFEAWNTSSAWGVLADYTICLTEELWYTEIYDYLKNNAPVGIGPDDDLRVDININVRNSKLDDIQISLDSNSDYTLHEIKSYFDRNAFIDHIMPLAENAIYDISCNICNFYPEESDYSEYYR